MVSRVEIQALKATYRDHYGGIKRNGEFFEVLEKLDHNIKEIAKEDNPMRGLFTARGL